MALVMKIPARVMLTAAALSAALLSLSCGCKQPSPAGPGGSPTPSTSPAPSAEPTVPGVRAPLLTPGSANYDRLEGTSFQNACSTDADCSATGCSSEVCAAEAVVSTCDVVVAKPHGGCGCVEGLCLWYKGGAEPTSCDSDGDCQNGKSCVKYYGIAGPNGPQFTSCEHPCGGGQACPAGEKCITIADGPGQVCR